MQGYKLDVLDTEQAHWDEFTTKMDILGKVLI